MLFKSRLKELENVVNRLDKTVGGGEVDFSTLLDQSQLLIGNGLKEQSELYKKELLKHRKQIKELQQQLKEALSVVGVEYYEAPAVKGWRKVENEE